MSSPSEILARSRTIAVVGCSATPGKDAHEIPRYLLPHFEVHPVNPTAREIFGKKAYASLADVAGPIDIVDVFRPSAEAPDVARQAIEVGAKALWLQLGIRSPEARRIAEDAGLAYVEDRCIMIEHRRMRATR